MAEKAKESRQVQKARRKLKLQILEEHKLITENALKKVSNDIKQWISRHSNERVQLKDKDISLFDENKHSAKVHSRFVKHLLEDLAQGKEPSTEDNLEGRVHSTVKDDVDEETDHSVSQSPGVSKQT